MKVADMPVTFQFSAAEVDVASYDTVRFTVGRVEIEVPNELTADDDEVYASVVVTPFESEEFPDLNQIHPVRSGNVTFFSSFKPESSNSATEIATAQATISDNIAFTKFDLHPFFLLVGTELQWKARFNDMVFTTTSSVDIGAPASIIDLNEGSRRWIRDEAAYATFKVKVVDRAGNSVPGAPVRLFGLPSNSEQSASSLTDENGIFEANVKSTDVWFPSFTTSKVLVEVGGIRSELSFIEDKVTITKVPTPPRAIAR
jgi:hypothetical protein